MVSKRLLMPSVVLLLMTAHGFAEDSYLARLRLPVDVYTQDGVHLEKGKIGVEVRKEKDHWHLVLSDADGTKAVVREQPGQTPATASQPTLPIVGTVYLRSKDMDLGTDEDRHYSKTGRPQYAEQERDWMATLRVYRSATVGRNNVQFLFHQKRARGRHTRASFQLSLKSIAIQDS